MDNVKGHKIHIGDNLLDEVETQVGLHSKEVCLVPRYTNLHCDSLEIISIKRYYLNSYLDNARLCHMPKSHDLVQQGAYTA